MRKRIGIWGATEEALSLIPLLGENPDAEIAAVVDRRAEVLRERLPHFAPDVRGVLEMRLTHDPHSLADDPHLYAVIDADPDQRFADRFPGVAERGVQVVTPLTARLLWGYGATSGDHKGELLQALHEIVESYNLTIDTDELFRRMLEIARSVTSADGGSLMLFDPERRELRVRVAAGIEPELWEKIRVPVGEGIAGRVAQDARPLCLRGKADRQTFRIVRERLDVESALCVPLVHAGRVLGVLNLHHSTRPDAFSQADLDFTEQLARLDAQIIARAQEHEALRNQAARYQAVREVQSVLSGRAPVQDRLTELCQLVAARAGEGIATVYLVDPEGDELRLAATSLEGGGFGSEYRVALGQGIDGNVALTREPAFLHRDDGAIAYAALPLVAGESLAGVLSIQSGPHAPRGRAAEETLLEMAAAAAEEIAQAEREARMAARATQVAAINETGIRMISATDPSEVLRLATSSAAMVLEADHAVLRLQDEETGRYSIRSYFGAADGRTQEKLFRLDKQVCVGVIKRRAPLIVRDLRDVDELADLRGESRSLLAGPLKREGRVIGTLSLYDKVASERFAIGHFGDEDLQLFAKFLSYAERAVANALSHARARQFRNFDEETGLPNAAYLARRVDEELARAGGRENALALAVCQVENLAEIERVCDPVRAKRVLKRVVTALGAHLRDFDVVGRTDDHEFTVLLPEPGFSPDERIFGLARAVADDVSKDDAVNEPIRVALAFGYAVHPSEGRDREALLERARVARIRMV